MLLTIPEMKGELLKVKEVAEILRTDERTVYTMVKQGAFPTIRWFDRKKSGGRGSAIYVLRSDLEEFISSRVVDRTKNNLMKE